MKITASIRFVLYFRKLSKFLSQFSLGHLSTKILLLSLLHRTGADYFDRIVGINAGIRRLHYGQSIILLKHVRPKFRGGNARARIFQVTNNVNIRVLITF